MIRALTASLILATSCYAADSAAGTAQTESKPEAKPSRFKMPSMTEISTLAGDIAQKLDSKLVYLEQGVTAMKPTVDALAQPANAKVTEKFALLAQSLPKLRVAVNALKSGKVSDPKAEISGIQENLKTAESLFTQLKSMLPATTAATTTTQKNVQSAK